jgi:hypothetical protein
MVLTYCLGQNNNGTRRKENENKKLEMDGRYKIT